MSAWSKDNWSVAKFNSEFYSKIIDALLCAAECTDSVDISVPEITRLDRRVGGNQVLYAQVWTGRISPAYFVYPSAPTEVELT